MFSVIYQKCVLNKSFIFIPSALSVLHALTEPQPLDTFFGACLPSHNEAEHVLLLPQSCEVATDICTRLEWKITG